jgi:hypothetical protein
VQKIHFHQNPFACNLFGRSPLLKRVTPVLSGIGQSAGPPFNNRQIPLCLNPPKRGLITMKNHLNAMLLTAALSGLIGGTSLAAQTATQSPAKASSVMAAKAGLRYASQDTTKHSCTGKNDCKGQGGCKSSDNGCKGKNSCKGKGGCATDGSKPHASI